jgi:hypothetical protein
MNRPSLSRSVPICFHVCLLLVAAEFAGQLDSCLLSGSSPQAQKPGQKLHGVLSQHRLNPPLRSPLARVRYSPDGRYLLVQDPSVVYLLSRAPLHFVGYLAAANSYDARFSQDSRSITLLSVGLSYEKIDIAEGKKIVSRDLPIHDGCLNAELSPDGELLACYRPDFSLGLFQISTDQWAYSEQGKIPPSPGSQFIPFFAPVSLDLDTAFPGAFGFILSNDMKPFANRGIVKSTMAFSPDGMVLIAGRPNDAIRLDVAGRKKVSLPGSIEKRMTGTFQIVDENRVLVIEKDKRDTPLILGLAKGQVLSNPSFKADRARLAANSRYALLQDSGIQGVRVFDLEKDRALDVAQNIGADVYGEELALYNENGDVFLYRLGEDLPFATVSLPLDSLPVLRSASLTPLFDKFALAIDEKGGLFQVSSGQRLASLPRFSAATLDDQNTGVVLLPPHHAAPAEVRHLDTVKGVTTPAWSADKALLHSGGTVLLEYSFESPMGRNILTVQEGGVPFMLRALDPANGQEFWKRSFSSGPPIPFADPQGSRLVLGWHARSEGARDAAKHDAAAKEILKKAKLSDHDSFFEVLDARTGKSLGGVLVQIGVGPAYFDAVFSEGDAVFVQKDLMRFSAYSLRDGQLKARLLGNKPATTAQANLLALDEGAGRLAICDLNSLAKLDEQLFADEIAYIRFSTNGKHLFVLTQHQEAFVLDVTRVRDIQPPATSPQTP